jgi:prepilin-type processing-associated H-X9-DG protein
MGIALVMYADESNAYPYGLDYANRRFWYDAIAPYYASNRNIMGCPGFKGNKNVDTAVLWLFPGADFFSYAQPTPGFTVNGVSYGYNGYGLRSTASGYSDYVNSLGLGHMLSSLVLVPPIRPSRVKAPADMIAVADSVRMPVVQQETYSFLLAVGDGSRPSPNRHNNGSNVSFADGHVENIPNKRLIADTEPARRRWNNDHEPHPEIVLPTPE